MTTAESWDLVAADGTVLGHVEGYERDMFWLDCHFAPTPAFAPVAPLFLEELRLLEREEMDAWELVYQRIDALGLELRPLDGTTPIREFILHVDGSHARLRY